MVIYVVAIIVIAYVFDFINGFHDSANSIATIVGTRVLSPFAAVVWAASFNFAAAFFGSTAVAKAVSSGYVLQSVVDANVICAALIGAIAWNLLTWFYGIPSSSSHALIGGFAGAALTKGGLAALTWGTKWIETVAAIAVSPLLGMLVALALMVAVFNILRFATPHLVDRLFRPGQLVSSAMLSFAHGENDAQKTMGVIVALLVAENHRFAEQTGFLHHLYLADAGVVPKWVALPAYAAISLGTLLGGWRIVHTMGSRITRLKPVSGFCAEGAGALVILYASKLGVPVSTTHTITGSIVGVGATQRLSGVRWGLAGRIVWAWVITIPAAAAIAGASYLVLSRIVTL
ncbi:MAG: inorganic phosphate transporter [Gemmatimonadaceae bacterium]|nr:inorganic phosphate transporter [Gemmatimonadaceae bacterium]